MLGKGGAGAGHSLALSVWSSADLFIPLAFSDTNKVGSQLKHHSQGQLILSKCQRSGLISEWLIKKPNKHFLFFSLNNLHWSYSPIPRYPGEKDELQTSCVKIPSQKCGSGTSQTNGSPFLLKFLLWTWGRVSHSRPCCIELEQFNNIVWTCDLCSF